MAYIGWYHMNLQVQRVQNIHLAKGSRAREPFIQGWVTADRSWPSLQDISGPNVGVTEKRHPTNFRPIILNLNQHGLKYVEPTLIHFQNDRTKIDRVSVFFCDTAYFSSWDPYWAYCLTLSRFNLETEARQPPPYTYSGSWVRMDSVGGSPTENSS